MLGTGGAIGGEAFFALTARPKVEMVVPCGTPDIPDSPLLWFCFGVVTLPKPSRVLNTLGLGDGLLLNPKSFEVFKSEFDDDFCSNPVGFRIGW